MRLYKTQYSFRISGNRGYDSNRVRFRALGKFEMAFWFFIKCFFRLVERKYPTDTVKCFFYSTSSICVSRFESQYIHLKAVLSKLGFYISYTEP